MTDCHIDFETKSDIDIRTRGSYVYFESPHTKPLMASYRFGKGPVRRWLPDSPCPGDIRAHAEAGGRFVGHNAGSFERRLWETILGPRYGWPTLKISQWRCTLAQASALGLPRSLEKMGDALNLKVKKDKVGKTLIKFFCTPIGYEDVLVVGSGDGWTKRPIFNDPDDHPVKFEQFRDYCDDDVLTESEADERMIPLSDAEELVWQLDQAVNDRGIRIDRASAIAAIRLIDKEKIRLDAEMAALTGGAVGACTQVARLTAWCEAQGVALAGVAKDDILEALDLIDIPAKVKAALLLRQEAGKSSTSKLKAFLSHAGADDRVRGSFVYHGAAPGRWSNVGVNFANLPRPRAIYDDAEIDAATLFKAFRTEEPQMLRDLYGPDLGRPLHLVSDAIRGFIWAAPGHDLIAVDYSGIQGALCAWAADEKWKLQAMREIIANPELPDLYRRTAAGIMNSTTGVITKKHWARQIGKVSELALGFAGGVAAFVSMARNYGLKREALHDLYGPVWAAAELAAREKAVRRYESCLKGRQKSMTDVLSREGWIACELIKTGWRATNPAIAEGWKTLEAGMRDAVRNPGTAYKALKLEYLVARGFLWARLPSGRCMAYAAPKLKEQVWAKEQLQDGSWGEAEVMDRDEAEERSRNAVDYGIGKFLGTRVKIEGATSPKVTALGVTSTTQKLERYAVYGGLATENMAMGLERDILVRGMQNCERAGYPIVFHTYDEAVAEVRHGAGSIAEMERLMLDLPLIYDGLPLAAHGWAAKRNHK